VLLLLFLTKFQTLPSEKSSAVLYLQNGQVNVLSEINILAFVKCGPQRSL